MLEEMKVGDLLYRVEVEREWLGERCFHQVVTQTYEVVKETPQGAWISRSFGLPLYDFGDKWISKKNTKKKFVCQTEQEALEQFIIRYEKRVSYLKEDLHEAEQMLKEAKGKINENNPRIRRETTLL